MKSRIAATESAGSTSNPAGSPLVIVAATALVPRDPFTSRRVAASTVHANGVAHGTPSPAPPDNHDNHPAPNEPTTPVAAAGAADITGAAAAAATGTAPAPPETTDAGTLTTDAAGTGAGDPFPDADAGAGLTTASARPPRETSTPPSEPADTAEK